MTGHNLMLHSVDDDVSRKMVLEAAVPAFFDVMLSG